MNNYQVMRGRNSNNNNKLPLCAQRGRFTDWETSERKVCLIKYVWSIRKSVTSHHARQGEDEEVRRVAVERERKERQNEKVDDTDKQM